MRNCFLFPQPSPLSLTLSPLGAPVFFAAAGTFPPFWLRRVKEESERGQCYHCPGPLLLPYADGVYMYIRVFSLLALCVSLSFCEESLEGILGEIFALDRFDFKIMRHHGPLAMALAFRSPADAYDTLRCC